MSTDKTVNEDVNTVTYNTGAVRSSDAEKTRYDLVSPIGLRRLAERYYVGSEKYSDYNWEKGMPIPDLLNHAVGHLYAYLSGDRSEDHLAAVAWGAFGAMHSEELWPELNTNMRGPGCTPPPGASLAKTPNSASLPDSSILPVAQSVMRKDINDLWLLKDVPFVQVEEPPTAILKASPTVELYSRPQIEVSTLSPSSMMKVAVYQVLYQTGERAVRLITEDGSMYAFDGGGRRRTGSVHARGMGISFLTELAETIEEYNNNFVVTDATIQAKSE